MADGCPFLPEALGQDARFCLGGLAVSAIVLVPMGSLTKML